MKKLSKLLNLVALSFLLDKETNQLNSVHSPVIIIMIITITTSQKSRRRRRRNPPLPFPSLQISLLYPSPTLLPLSLPRNVKFRRASLLWLMTIPMIVFQLRRRLPVAFCFYQENFLKNLPIFFPSYHKYSHKNLYPRPPQRRRRKRRKRRRRKTP